MAVTRWRPRWRIRRWEPFRRMEDEMDRFLAEWPFDLRPWTRRPFQATEWVPRVDMFDREDKVIIRAELPGLEAEDIDISVAGDILTIRGERKAEEELKDEDYYCCERYVGSFSRDVHLPADVDTEKIEANYQDGVLEIALPKVPEVKPKKIRIRSE